MVDIALDLGRGLEGDRFCANDARDFAAHHDLFEAIKIKASKKIAFRAAKDLKEAI